MAATVAPDTIDFRIWAQLESCETKLVTEMALHVLAYNLTRVMNILGTKALMAAIRA